MNFAKALRICRAARGVNQQELADDAGVSAAYISLIENGKREPTIASMRKLAGALEVPLDLMMLLAIESNDQPKAKSETVSRVAQTLLRMVANPELDEHAI